MISARERHAAAVAIGVKRRQQDVEHALGIAPDDEQRQQVLAHDDERHQRDDERDDRQRVADVAERAR